MLQICHYKTKKKMKRILLLSILGVLIFLPAAIRCKRVHGNGNVGGAGTEQLANYKRPSQRCIKRYFKKDSDSRPIKVETDENLQELVEYMRKMECCTFSQGQL